MAGYSNTPLQKKLGLKSGMKCHVIEPPDNYFELLSPMPDGVVWSARVNGVFDFIHVFVQSRKLFEAKFKHARSHLASSGMLWVSWPKKAAKIQTDLDENVIRHFGLSEGLVDVKVCAVDETWSGLKFVYRLKDRA